MAGSLQADLVIGKPCPVCTQEVTDMPAAVGGGVVAGASKALASHRKDRVAADTKLQAAIRTHQDLAARRQAAGEEMKRLHEMVVTAAAETAKLEAVERENEARLEGLLGVTGAHDEALASQKAVLVTAAQAVADGRKGVEAARRVQDEAIEAEQRGQQTLSALRVSLAEVAAKLEIDLDTGEAGLGDLRKAVTAAIEAWQGQSAAVEHTLAVAESSITGATLERTRLLDELDLQTASLSEELGSARARATERAAEIKRIESELEVAQRLIADRDHLVSRRDVMQRLATDLTDSKFIRFLLDEERAVLSELGTEHLLRLTSGRYEFDDSGAFNIVDLTAADAVRKPDSLSGGETFLASLALALALAEMVARTGGRLDAFFLDEGFGSLDPEHLDLAMEGIESLVSADKDRLVVVVSHVPELRHRLEDLIELDRSPTTGDTRVIRA
jgi:exonuclease SbcC